MKNTYIFEEDEYSDLNDGGFNLSVILNEENESLLEKFKKKYPEVEGRFKQINVELLFCISQSSEISEKNWTVDFLESNVNNGRHINGEGVKLSSTFYNDLFNLFQKDGKVYFENESSFYAMKTIGKFDSYYLFELKADGLHWSEGDEF